MHVKTQSLPHSIHTKTTHALPVTDKKARLEYYIKQGQTKLPHKHNTNKISLWSNRENYGGRENFGHKSITGYDVTHKYKEERNVQKEQNILSTDVLIQFIVGKW